MMKNSIENIIKENKIMVIDGSMSTPLENRGVSLNSKLWTAKILAEQPELIKQVHKNYFKAGADIILFETVPSLKEAKVEAEIAEEYGYDYWISFSCKDGLHINEGDLIRDCAAAFRSGYPRLRALGVNCTKPEYLESLIKELGKETDLPIVVYPNSGETYDPVTKTWNGKGDGHSFKDYEAGARAVGGCCTTVSEHIVAVAKAREEFLDRQSKA